MARVISSCSFQWCNWFDVIMFQCGDVDDHSRSVAGVIEFYKGQHLMVMQQEFDYETLAVYI